MWILIPHMMMKLQALKDLMTMCVGASQVDGLALGLAWQVLGSQAWNLTPSESRRSTPPPSEPLPAPHPGRRRAERLAHTAGCLRAGSPSSCPGSSWPDTSGPWLHNRKWAATEPGRTWRFWWKRWGDSDPDGWVLTLSRFFWMVTLSLSWTILISWPPRYMEFTATRTRTRAMKARAKQRRENVHHVGVSEHQTFSKITESHVLQSVLWRKYWSLAQYLLSRGGPSLFGALGDPPSRRPLASPRATRGLFCGCWWCEGHLCHPVCLFIWQNLISYKHLPQL